MWDAKYDIPISFTVGAMATYELHLPREVKFEAIFSNIGPTCGLQVAHSKTTIRNMILTNNVKKICKRIALAFICLNFISTDFMYQQL